MPLITERGASPGCGRRGISSSSKSSSSSGAEPFSDAPFSGIPPRPANGTPEKDGSYGERLRLAAAAGGYQHVMVYWGQLESLTTNGVTKAVSWVPIVGMAIPDESQQMRIRLKAAIVEVATGLPLALGSDNTNAAGFYSVVVPPGLMDVVFSPPGVHFPREKRHVDGVSVTANTTLDATLPGAPRTVFYAPPRPPSPNPRGPINAPFGAGIRGSNGVPHVLGERVRGGTRIHLFGGRPGAAAQRA